MLLGNAVSINQVMVTHLRGLEQLLGQLPAHHRAAASPARTADGYGHVNLQFDSDVQPCTEGYLPPDEWRQGNDLTDGPIFPARCNSPRAVRRARLRSTRPGRPLQPEPGPRRGRLLRPATGVVSGAVDENGNPIRYVDPGNLSVLGGDSWKWLLVGPVS